MSVFCLLWMPLFYLFWRSVTGTKAAAGGIWAFILGSVAALLQFFLGSIVEPRGFGLSRWVSGCIDIVALPALAPILACLLLISLKVIAGTADFANFAMLWLIPGGAVRALSGGSSHDPIVLVAVPLLWTALAVGIPFFISMILNNRRWAIVPASLGILAAPFAAASSYWAFYAQKTSWGFLFLLAAAAPALVSMIIAFFRGNAA